MDPAEITTARLLLRPWRPADEQAVLDACQDPEVQEWTTVPVPYTREDARAFLARTEEGWRTGTRASFAVVLRETGEVVASVNLHHIEDAMAGVGYWCAALARGQGLMSEAVTALCRWGFEVLELRRIEWAAAVGNAASRAVAEKCGFEVEGTARQWLVRRGEPLDAWRGALLATDELVDRRALPPPVTLTDGTVTLRPWSLSDVEDSVRAMNDEDLARYRAIPQPYTAAHARSWISRFALHGWAEGTGAELAVTDAATGELLGGVGLKTRMRALGIVEVSYWTAPWARGRGLAGRAALLLSEWALSVLGVQRVELLADVENVPSQQVAERAGFVREGVARASRRDGQGVTRDMVVFSRVSLSRGTADPARRG